MSKSLSDLIPVPQKMDAVDGVFDAGTAPWRVSTAALAHTAVAFKLGSELSVEVVAAEGIGAFDLLIGDADAAALKAPDVAEGYALRVTPQGVALRGRDMDGLYWGLVTLEQLLDGGAELPCCRIDDWPVCRWRGHHDDISRKQISRTEDFCLIIRRLSQFKLNIYMPYMEDVLHIESQPDIGVGRGRLEPDEVARMHEEAARHNVMIVPVYSLIGHQENLLAQPQFAHLGREVFQPMSSLDPTKPAVREFLAAAIDDVCDMFPAPFFHACFDEVIGLTREEFISHANWCAERLAARGKKMLMWVDMINNHFGCEAVQELAENIIPVNWRYRDTDFHRDLIAQGRPVWPLAGYQNWSTLIPKFSAGRKNITDWMREAIATDTPALCSSQWGDNGYENHRDFAWNTIALLGESGWTGREAEPADFERRFQERFYGAALPALADLVLNLQSRLSMEAGDYWQHHRRTAFEMLRWVHENPDVGAAAAADEKVLTAALAAVDGCAELAVRNVEHLEHWRVGLAKSLSVAHRLQFAARYIDGMDRADIIEGVQELRDELGATREAYIADWVRTNREPNMEVSLQVYTHLFDGLDYLIEACPGAPGREGAFYKLDMSEHWNECAPALGGVPVGHRESHQIPYLFADMAHTHVGFGAESDPLALPFEEQAVSDLHLLLTAPRTFGELAPEPKPVLAVELLKQGEVVFREELLLIEHLADCWALHGESMWGGGGLAHVDPDRVRYAWRGSWNHGVMEVHNFAVPCGTLADELRMTALGEDTSIKCFAATLEVE
jgi:Glycosyl hydrolase family 20, domain 2